MRVILSTISTCVGLAAVHLFASGALSGLTWSRASLTRALEHALRPFVTADLVSTILVTAGMAAFAIGLLVAPRAGVWVAVSRGKGEDPPPLESYVFRYSREVSREKVLEIAFAFNVVVVGALLALLGTSVFRPGPSDLVGALYLAGVLEALLGSCIMVYLIARKRTGKKRSRPLFAASAGANIVEVIVLTGVYFSGVLDSAG